MPTSSQFKIISTLERKTYSPAWRINHSASTGDQNSYPDGGNQFEHAHTSANRPPASAPVPESSLRAPYGRRVGSAYHAFCSAGHARFSYATRDSPERSLSVPIVKDNPPQTSENPASDTGASTKEIFKRRLYGLGFRGLPGEKAGQWENLEMVLRQRPGIHRNMTRRADRPPEKEEAVVIEGITTQPEKPIDISCVDQKLLRPTALCFDSTGLDISHLELKRAVDKVLPDCDGAQVKTVQYENRRLKGGNLPNRWMIYADCQESRDAMCGRTLRFGDRYVVLRRHDDLVLLAYKRALRAEAWKNILSQK